MDDQLEFVENILSLGSGLVGFIGPTGTGKTCTRLYFVYV